MDDFREVSRQLITSVALITSHGNHGNNVMAAEWTFQVSYQPMRLIVLVHPSDATYDNLTETREFGANFLSDDQAALANLAGFYTGKETDKLSSQLFQTYPAEKITPLMIAGCFVNAECRVAEVFETGDHIMFLGDIVSAKFDAAKQPLLYNQRRYWQRGPQLEKKPLIYVTCTVKPDEVRLEGRLQGPQQNPQKVSLMFGNQQRDSLFEGKADTDERGYFEFVHKLETPLPRTTHVATASWNGLTGSAIANPKGQANVFHP